MSNHRTYDAQLFTSDGKYVTTVAHAPIIPGIIIWRQRYFASREGRYVEVHVFRTDEEPR
jgi:hypothetical protein